jgi:hypothetical protein
MFMKSLSGFFFSAVVFVGVVSFQSAKAEYTYPYSYNAGYSTGYNSMYPGSSMYPSSTYPGSMHSPGGVYQTTRVRYIPMNSCNNGYRPSYGGGCQQQFYNGGCGANSYMGGYGVCYPGGYGMGMGGMGMNQGCGMGQCGGGMGMGGYYPQNFNRGCCGQRSGGFVAVQFCGIGVQVGW